ncbi:hypothetical protein BGZ89_010222 [Linnemannia elongata]|nr:hypothetical protein BGZ89_010222 [Linnemannia elongata]
MHAHQRFRHGDLVESLALRTDTNGVLYSQLSDIQDFFPGAARFKIGNVNLLFLEDDSGQRHEPRRIAHYPDFTIDVVLASQVESPLSPPTSAPSRIETQDFSSNHVSRAPSEDEQFANGSLVLLSDAPTPSPFTSHQWSTSLPSTTRLVTRPILELSSIAAEISHIQQQLERSADQQSAYHQQLLEKLVHMMQEQAESKEREERMLQDQAESKAREEKMLRMQQETIDRLIVNQQRVDAILVQNYELHEYPIPRLFVILPNSYQTWDPRSFLTERFRLFFLCECGEHCRADSRDNALDLGRIPANFIPAPGSIQVKNSIHLANHEGYEISRPTDFFDRYGPYVLGMLKILKHCLTVASMVAPAAQGSLDDVVQGVESLARNTLEAVDMSIGFLEQKLENFKTMNEQEGEEDEDVFGRLAALEGADLRRLDTFLRNNDQDKILGNLYRITTDAGHVKWVCLEHYREAYRETAMRAFLQIVETSAGVYDPHLRKVSIGLKSSTTAQDFFKRLTTQAPAVNELDVSLDWKFSSSDLSVLTESLAKSNIRYLKLDLKEKYGDDRPRRETVLPGKGKYQAILGLLSNRKLQGLALTNIYYFGLRTSQLSSQAPSCLRSFYYLQRVTASDEPRLIGILSLSPGLADLRLGSFAYFSEGCPNLSRAIEALPKLQSLHLQYMSSVVNDVSAGGASNFTRDKPDCPPYGINRLRELVCGGVSFDVDLLEDVARRSSTLLEVLALRSADDQVRPFNLYPTDSKVLLSQRDDSSSPLYTVEPIERPFSNMTHLDLRVQLTKPSMDFLASVLPRLELVHFGANGATKDLLRYINYASLKSIWLAEMDDYDLQPFYDAVFSDHIKDPRHPPSSQIESIRVSKITGFDNVSSLVRSIPLKRLQMIDCSQNDLVDALLVVNLSRLQELSIFQQSYDWPTEAVLALRSNEFTEELVVKYGYYDHVEKQKFLLEESRGLEGTKSKLARGRVQAIGMMRQYEEYSQSIFGGHT